MKMVAVTYSLCKHCWIPLLQHLFKLLVRCGFSSCQHILSLNVGQVRTWIQLTDLQLTLYPRFTSLSVIGLRPIVFCHHLYKLPWQRWVLCLTYSQVGGRWLGLLFLLDALLNSLGIKRFSLSLNIGTFSKVSDCSPLAFLELCWHFS